MSHGRVEAPGLGGYPWGSALLHFGVVVGLTLLWGTRAGDPFGPRNAPLQIALLQPDAEAEKASSLDVHAMKIVCREGSRVPGIVLRSPPEVRHGPGRQGWLKARREQWMRSIGGSSSLG